MIVLKWPSWVWEKKAGWKCRWFGHVWEPGWYGDLPYLDAKPGPVDNIGRHHVRLLCECSRCGTTSQVAWVHDWEKKS
ncbi:hypothetical protein ACUN0C_18745 [Faunimonas sp. B44]|uniref:hypothetical protein n=1 Tax=Faunimonas sp. B44 TaxID=3461493 RepID=UPI0040446278